MDQAQVGTFKETFSGEVIVAGDPEYATASNVLMKEGSPLLIVRPRTTQDVAMALAFAKKQGLVLSIRSGGHNNAGTGTNDGGMVIEMTHFNEITVIDEAKSIVRLGSGAHWGDVGRQLLKDGLVVTAGDTVSVGVGGLTLGAGVGWMVRKYGLAIDNLVAAEMVVPDGRVLRVSKDENPDLFWAIRGGGGNFGVVTHFEFQAHKQGKVHAGPIMFNLENLEELLRGWRDYMRVAPAELTTMFMVMPSFGDYPPMAVVTCCYAGQDYDGAIQPLLKLGAVTQQFVVEKDYPDVLEEAQIPPGMKVGARNVFVSDFSDELIAAIADEAPKSNLVLQIRHVGGALNKVPVEATAFAHRQSEVLIICPRFVPPTASDADMNAAFAPWERIAAFGKGAYVNFFSELTREHVAMAYPKATYERLAHIKKQYDPTNLLNQNFNIEPSE